jgi:predicted ATPase
VRKPIRQYASERLREDEGEAEVDRVRGRHGSHYAAFLGEREPHVLGRRQGEAPQEILEDMDNVWAAWNWALERGDVDSIGKCVRALEEVAELRGWHHDIHQAFDRAAAKLRERLRAPRDLDDREPL